MAQSFVLQAFRPAQSFVVQAFRPASAADLKVRTTFRDDAGSEAQAATETAVETLSPDRPLIFNTVIKNTDRAFGASIAGAIAERFGDAGLPHGSVRIVATGSAGQSFGAFTLPGMSLTLVGDANDCVAKGMHGGEIAILSQSTSRDGSGQVLAGNSVLYGATGGRVFIAGAAGERFAVRNSGATAIVEGIGDHGCEYMTGGTVVVLGPVGRNFAAGMSGGVAYVYDDGKTLAARCPGASCDELDAGDRECVRELLTMHESATGSPEAARILRHEAEWSCFWKVTPATATASHAANATVAPKSVTQSST